jgi:hypothetical protein
MQRSARPLQPGVQTSFPPSNRATALKELPAPPEQAQPRSLPSPKSPGIDHKPQVGLRRFAGSDGCEWSAREAAFPLYDRRSGFCLVFESAEVLRKVRSYPADWLTCPESTLIELCEGLLAPRSAGAAQPFVPVCVFSENEWPEIVCLAADRTAPRIIHFGRPYARYSLSAMLDGPETVSAIVYCANEPARDDELTIFQSLYPSRGGVFRLERDPA